MPYLLALLEHDYRWEGSDDTARVWTSLSFIDGRSIEPEDLTLVLPFLKRQPAVLSANPRGILAARIFADAGPKAKDYLPELRILLSQLPATGSQGSQDWTEWRNQLERAIKAIDGPRAPKK
jgi:hypothetical protein